MKKVLHSPPKKPHFEISLTKSVAILVRKWHHLATKHVHPSTTTIGSFTTFNSLGVRFRLENDKLLGRLVLYVYCTVHTCPKIVKIITWEGVSIATIPSQTFFIRQNYFPAVCLSTTSKLQDVSANIRELGRPLGPLPFGPGTLNGIFNPCSILHVCEQGHKSFIYLSFAMV